MLTMISDLARVANETIGIVHANQKRKRGNPLRALLALRVSASLTMLTMLTMISDLAKVI
jgi:hypothetical protein